MLPRSWSSCVAVTLIVTHINLTLETVAATDTPLQLALCVGIETYDPEVFARLKHAEDDARDLAATLTELGYQVLLMTPDAENPRHKPNTPQKVLSQLKLRTAGLTEADTLIVSLSGQGVQFKNDPVGPDGAKDAYFCPQDAQLDDRSSLVSLRDILKIMTGCSAKRKLLIVDAWRIDVLSESAKGRLEIELDFEGLTRKTVPDGMQVLFSCAPQERSVEFGDLGHSAFMHHVLKYLRGVAERSTYADQHATMDGLALYTKSSTQAYVQQHLKRSQAPILVGHKSNWTIGKVARLGPTAVIRHQGPISKVAFRAEGQLLTAEEVRTPKTSVKEDRGVLRLWDIATQEEVRRTVLPDFVRSLAVKDDLVLAGTIVSPGVVVLWNAQTGEVLHTFDPTTQWSVVGVSFDKDPNIGLSSSLSETAVAFLDLKSGAVGRKIDDKTFLGGIAQDGNHISETRFCPGSATMLVNVWTLQPRREDVILASTETGRQIQHFSSMCKTIRSIDLSPDGKFAAEAGEPRVTVWSCARGNVVWTRWMSSTVVRFSPDGKYVAVAHGKSSGEPGKKESPSEPVMVTLHDAVDGSEIARFEGHDKIVTDLAFSPGGLLLASASNDGTACLWPLPPQSGTRHSPDPVISHTQDEKLSQRGEGTKAGQEWSGNSLGMKFCWCPPGTFIMGEQKPNEQSTQVPVTLTKGFWIGKYEVTQREWQTIMKTTLLKQASLNHDMKTIPGTGDSFPMFYVSEYEAFRFASALTARDRREGRLLKNWSYQLPTEAQWEYACRAGTTTATAFGDSIDSSQVNFRSDRPASGGKQDTFRNSPAPVGSYRPNAWGIYDMHGNVREWCRDSWSERPPGGHDPFVRHLMTFPVVRGGSWSNSDELCTSSYRWGENPMAREDNLGFRIVIVQTIE